MVLHQHCCDLAVGNHSNHLGPYSMIASVIFLIYYSSMNKYIFKNEENPSSHKKCIYAWNILCDGSESTIAGSNQMMRPSLC